MFEELDENESNLNLNKLEDKEETVYIKILVLDDEKYRHNAYRDRFNDHKNKIIPDHCFNAEECINNLDKNKYNVVFLDHDLDGRIFVDANDRNTGSEVAKWISKNLSKIEGSRVIVHSLNSNGANNMLSLIPNAEHVPGAWMKDVFDSLNI